MKKSNQDLAIAFATGGFDWVAQGKIVALTELEAEQLLADKKQLSSVIKQVEPFIFHM